MYFISNILSLMNETFVILCKLKDKEWQLQYVKNVKHFPILTSLWYSLLKYQDVSVRFASHRHYSHLQSITWLAGNSQREKVKIFNCYLCHTISFCFIFQAFFIWHSTENATEHCFIISFLFPFDTFFFMRVSISCYNMSS